VGANIVIFDKLANQISFKTEKTFAKTPLILQ